MNQWKVTGGSYDSAGRGVFTVTKGSMRLDHREQDELEALLAGWRPIETAPQNGTLVDLWCANRNERLTNYRRVHMSKSNIFYEPLRSGRAVVRDATHWMLAPAPPK